MSPTMKDRSVMQNKDIEMMLNDEAFFPSHRFGLMRTDEDDEGTRRRDKDDDEEDFEDTDKGEEVRSDQVAFREFHLIKEEQGT